MNIWRQKTSIVSKLRVKGNGFDTLGTRLHFERLFGEGNFLPSGLPAKAIVCIKNLRDPAPRTLRLSRADLRYSDAWRHSVAKEIETLYRRAFRPISETVPARAESIVFADDTELLACLASDWCQGLLPEHWWWRSLFPNLQHAQTIARIWIESAEFAPTALRFLALKGKAVRFAAKLQPDEIKNLLRQIIFVFGLDKLQNALIEPFEKETEPEFSSPEKLTEPRIPSDENYFSAAPQRFAPWREIVPETRNPALSFEQQCLLGVGLMLARAPRIVRTAEFAEQAKIFRSAFEAGKTSSENENPFVERKRTAKRTAEKIGEISYLRENPEPVLDEVKTAAGKNAGKKTSKNLKDSPDTIEKNIGKVDFENISKSETLPPKEKKRKAVSGFIFEDLQTEKISGRRENVRKTKSRHAEDRPVNETFFAETEEEFETEIVIETRFGGVFYLLNLGLYLNLYRDFSTPAQAEIDLNIWDFVAFLGREFSGEKIEKDAVWKLLERLAGRENSENPGNGFAPPDDWRMPLEWLKFFRTNEKWFWKNDDERLIVRHPAGFNVIDVKSSGDAKNQLENELKNYRKNISQTEENFGEESFEHSSPMENWLKNLSEYMLMRLSLALNIETREQVNAILFERKARVGVTETNLDLTFSLADLPFEIRLSGLDRDPGWIPAAGKFVRFHFV